MKVIYSKDFLKQASALPTKLQDLLDTCLHVLSLNPFYPTLHTKKLKGELKNMLSFRITRDWRVIFMFQSPDEIKLIRIGNRKDIYR
jgi:addiction module RelE/StbE family toxin